MMDAAALPWTVFLLNSVHLVNSHGRLIEPPSRATMWRYGFDTPPNYNDHELYCGGYTRQWQTNGGKCGVCGDPWDMPKPRPHEAGGKYGKGIIVRKYKKDSPFTIRVELTANHKGYFEFRLCPNNAPHRVATQTCLDKYLLKQARNANGATYGDDPVMQDEHRYYPTTASKVFEMRYMLPKGLTCTQCVLQWRYIAGNNWGMCSNGTGEVGCGPQEEFRACADVSIVDSKGAADETPFDNEIDDDEAIQKTEDGATIPHKIIPTMEWWLLLIIIALSALLLVLLTFTFIYCYYRNKDRVKEWWWQQRHVSVIGGNPPGKKFHFWKRLRRDQSKLRFWRPNSVNASTKNSKFIIPQPVPPPRLKRNQTPNILEA